jgi:hypothetical protein
VIIETKRIEVPYPGGKGEMFEPQLEPTVVQEKTA